VPRVLHVIDSLAPGGGAENRFVEELLGFSDRSGQRVVFLFERDQLAAPLRDAGIPVQGLGLRAARGGRTFPWAAVKLVRIIRAHRPEVVHTSLFHANVAGQLAAWVSGVPVVSSFVQSGDPELRAQLTGGLQGRRRAGVIRAVAAWVARRSGARYRAITSYAGESNATAMRLDPARVRVIPRGVALERAGAAADRGRFGLPEGVPLIVNVARQEPQKGHVRLVEAFALVRDQVPGAHLAIVGTEGAATPAIREAIGRLGLDRAVTLVGWRPDVPVLLASADAFAFSSTVEGLGSVVLEALLAGLPVVAVDIPPVRAITDDGRLATLVPADDVAAFATALLAALAVGRQPESAGARWVREEYDGARVGPRVEAYLAEVAATARPRRRLRRAFGRGR
jgi:glycosyltransferase involved in cell wall biosynthesis